MSESNAGLFETIQPKTAAQFEAFGYSLLSLLNNFAENPHYKLIVDEFVRELIHNAPSAHTVMGNLLIDAINDRDAKEKAAQAAKEGKQKGLGKFNAKVTAKLDDDDEEAAAGSVEMLTEEQLAALAAKEARELEEERKRNTEEAKRKAEEEERRRKNLEELNEKKRKVDAAEVASKLANQGFEVLAPAPWEKAGKKKGR